MPRNHNSSAPIAKNSEREIAVISKPIQKKAGKRPYPLRTFFAWILGVLLLGTAFVLFFHALIPATILIAIAFVITPTGEEFLYKVFGFDFCRRCKSWILIIGGLLFVASLGAMV